MKSLAARIGKLEREREAAGLPAIIISIRAEHESQAQARERRLSELGIVDRAGLSFACLDAADLKLL